MSRKPSTKVKKPPAPEAGGGRVRIQIKNLGRIKSADIELAPLTIIAGPNSTGKTYLNYAILALLINAREWAYESEVVAQSGRDIASGFVSAALVESMRRELPELFGTQFGKIAHVFLNKDPNSLLELEASLFLGAARTGLVPLPEWLKSTSWASSTSIKEDPSGINVVFTPGNHRVGEPAVVKRQLFVSALLSSLPEKTFPVTSERTGVALFYRDLDLNRSRIFDELIAARSTPVGKENARLIDTILSGTSRYAAPIRDNIDMVRDFEDLSKRRSFLSEDGGGRFAVLEMLNEILGGEFSVSDGIIGFALNDIPESHVPIAAASSAAKSLLLVDLFLRNLATPGSMLVIDEPELNLHPANQRKMARLLVRAVNAGIKVLITTHSDWLIRELSSCIALHREKGRPAQELLELAGATAADCLDPTLVRAYQTTLEGTVQSLRVDASGMDVSSLDEAILDANQFYDEVRELTGDQP